MTEIREILLSLLLIINCSVDPQVHAFFWIPSRQHGLNRCSDSILHHPNDRCFRARITTRPTSIGTTSSSDFHRDCRNVGSFCTVQLPRPLFLARTDMDNSGSNTNWNRNEESNQDTATTTTTTTTPPTTTKAVTATCQNGTEMLSYNDCERQLRQWAACTAIDDTVCDRATRMVATMKDPPDTVIYNLLLEVYAYSKIPNAVLLAENLVEQMKNDTNRTTASVSTVPSSATYATLMDAYMQHQQWDKIDDVVKCAQEESRMDTILWNKLIQAHGRRGDPVAAMQILENMLSTVNCNHNDDDENDNNKNDSTMNNNHILHESQPNQKTWIQVLRAYAAQGDTVAIKDLLHRMRKNQHRYLDWAPTTTAYNTLLQAYAKQGEAKAAERLLYRMMEEETIIPNQESFFYVFTALSRQKPKSGITFKVEQLLALQEAFVKQQNTKGIITTTATTTTSSAIVQEPFRPDARTLQIAAIAMTRDNNDPLKVIKAGQLLQRIEPSSNSNNNDTESRCMPNSLVYRTLFYACAHVPLHSTPEEKHAIFNMAMDLFHEPQWDMGRNEQTYVQLIRIASNLIPSTTIRDQVVERIFRTCCEEGMCSTNVLKEWYRCASDALILNVMGGFQEDGIQPPSEWSRNVNESTANNDLTNRPDVNVDADTVTTTPTPTPTTTNTTTTTINNASAPHGTSSPINARFAILSRLIYGDTSDMEQLQDNNNGVPTTTMERQQDADRSIHIGMDDHQNHTTNNNNNNNNDQLNHTLTTITDFNEDAIENTDTDVLGTPSTTTERLELEETSTTPRVPDLTNAIRSSNSATTTTSSNANTNNLSRRIYRSRIPVVTSSGQGVSIYPRTPDASLGTARVGQRLRIIAPTNRTNPITSSNTGPSSTTTNPTNPESTMSRPNTTTTPPTTAAAVAATAATNNMIRHRLRVPRGAQITILHQNHINPSSFATTNVPSHVPNLQSHLAIPILQLEPVVLAEQNLRSDEMRQIVVQQEETNQSKQKNTQSSVEILDNKNNAECNESTTIPTTTVDGANSTTPRNTEQKATTTLTDLDQYKCSICYDYMDIPVGCGLCSGRFCKDCLDQVIQSNNVSSIKCPTCRSEFVNPVVDTNLSKQLDQIAVLCQFAACPIQEPITLSQYKHHELNCSGVRVSCRYAPYGCIWQGYRLELNQHEVSNCILAQVPGLLEQIRLLQITHQREMSSMQQERTYLLSSMNAMETALNTTTMYYRSNFFHQLVYLTNAALSTARLLSNKAVWQQMFHSPDARAHVFNTMTILPTMILIAKVIATGIHTHCHYWTWENIFMLVRSDQLLSVLAFGIGNNDTINSSLEDESTTTNMALYMLNQLIGYCTIGLLGLLLILCLYADESSQTWRTELRPMLRQLSVSNSPFNFVFKWILMGWDTVVNTLKSSPWNTFIPNTDLLQLDSNLRKIKPLQVIANASSFFIHYRIAKLQKSGICYVTWISLLVGTVLMPCTVTAISHQLANAPADEIKDFILRKCRALSPILKGIMIGPLIALLGLVPCLDGLGFAGSCFAFYHSSKSGKMNYSYLIPIFLRSFILFAKTTPHDRYTPVQNMFVPALLSTIIFSALTFLFEMIMMIGLRLGNEAYQKANRGANIGIGISTAWMPRYECVGAGATAFTIWTLSILILLAA